MKNIDLTGCKFGRLIVERLAYSKKSKKFWVCVCECGEKVITFTAQLTSGKAKSCGCLHKDIIRKCSYGEAAFNKLYSSYRRQAEKRNLKFDLTKEQFKTLTSGNCHYCNEPPQMIWKEKGQLWGECVYNGVDRINSDLGYSVENCVSCCKVHNRMKGELSLVDFINACKQVVNHFSS